MNDKLMRVLKKVINILLKLDDEYFSIDSASEYLSHAVILICDKGTNDSQLFLAALDTLISIVTDPICQLRMYFYRSINLLNSLLF